MLHPGQAEQEGGDPILGYQRDQGERSAEHEAAESNQSRALGPGTQCCHRERSDAGPEAHRGHQSAVARGPDAEDVLGVDRQHRQKGKTEDAESGGKEQQRTGDFLPHGVAYSLLKGPLPLDLPCLSPHHPTHREKGDDYREKARGIGKEAGGKTHCGNQSRGDHRPDDPGEVEDR